MLLQRACAVTSCSVLAQQLMFELVVLGQTQLLCLIALRCTEQT